MSDLAKRFQRLLPGDKKYITYPHCLETQVFKGFPLTTNINDPATWDGAVNLITDLELLKMQVGNSSQTTLTP